MHLHFEDGDLYILTITNSFYPKTHLTMQNSTAHLLSVDSRKLDTWQTLRSRLENIRTPPLFGLRYVYSSWKQCNSFQYSSYLQYLPTLHIVLCDYNNVTLNFVSYNFKEIYKKYWRNIFPYFDGKFFLLF